MFTKNCPQCNKLQTYSRKDGLQLALKKNSLCIKCFNQNLHKQHYDGFPKKFTKKQKNLLVGCLLGDGSLSKHEICNSRFYYTQQLKNRERVEEIQKILKPFSYDIDVRKGKKPFKTNKGIIHSSTKFLWRAEVRTCQHPMFSQLRQYWYPQGVKIIPRDLYLNWEIFAHWFQDDGSHDKKRKKLVLATHSFSEDDLNFLIEVLFRDLNIQATKHKNYDTFALYISRKNYNEVIYNMSPYVISQCMFYKVIPMVNQS